MANYGKKASGIIKRYYDQKDNIMLDKLGRWVTDLYLVETEPKRKKLWGSVEKALQQLEVKQDIIDGIVKERDVQSLAEVIAEIDRVKD